MSESTKISLNADRALFEGQFTALALSCYQNERPPCGLLGIMDWHFHGLISKYIRQGAILGKVGECVYLPFAKNGMTFHLVLTGGGTSNTPGERNQLPHEALQVLQKNLVNLKISKVGISKSDFGNVSNEALAKNLKGVSLWITP